MNPDNPWLHTECTVYLGPLLPVLRIRGDSGYCKNLCRQNPTERTKLCHIHKMQRFSKYGICV